MAEGKKSFVLYSDLISVVKKLVEKDRENKTNYAGELFLHILEYVNDNNPIPIDFIVEMAFEPIKLSLKRDLDRYAKRCNKNKENALKRWETKNSDSNNDDANACDRINGNAKHADSDNDSDNDSDINNNTSSTANPLDSSKKEFYLTKKKKKLSGKRLETFNEFWNIFNYKKGRAEAADAWLEIPMLTKEICNKINVSAKIEADKRTFNKSGTTPKMATGWLNARRWEDEEPSNSSEETKSTIKISLLE